MIDYSLGDEMVNVIFGLPDTVHGQELGVEDFLALLFEERFPDDDIDVACLVFEREKKRAIRSRWPLTHGDEAGGAGKLTVAKVFHFQGGG